MRTRSRHFLPIVAGLALGLVTACEEDPTGPAAGESFTLAPGERATLRPIGTRVRFLRVAEDFRCPLQAECVWAGDGAVLLEIAPPTGDTAEETLHTNESAGPRSVVLDRYELMLLALDPYPQVPGGIDAEDYRVVLVLQERVE